MNFNVKNIFYTATLSMLITGCHSNNFFTAKYERDDMFETGSLPRNSSILIATANDGSYMDKTYPGSGAELTKYVKSAFSTYNQDVKISKCSTIKCMQEEELYAYCVIPEISHWEDRATEWSSVPDKIIIKLSVYDGYNFKPVSSTSITGLSKWFTFGGDHPQDLVEKPVAEYVKNLYQPNK